MDVYSLQKKIFKSNKKILISSWSLILFSFFHGKSTEPNKIELFSWQKNPRKLALAIRENWHFSSFLPQEYIRVLIENKFIPDGMQYMHVYVCISYVTGRGNSVYQGFTLRVLVTSFG